MAHCYIARANKKGVVQTWLNVPAAWGALQAGHSRDVQWGNIGSKISPMMFDTEGLANWYLRKRKERITHDDDKNWTYFVVKEWRDG